MLLTLFINNLLTDQHLSRVIEPHIMNFTVLKFAQKYCLHQQYNQQYNEENHSRYYLSRTEPLYFLRAIVGVNG